MKQVTLSIDESKFDTLMKFLKTLNYVQVSETDMTVLEFQSSLKQVKLMKMGKLPKKPIEKLLNGLSD